MRFEAKHKVFKNTLKNFKNITKSLAKKHQMSIAYHWETLSLNHIEYGPLKSFTVDNEDSDMFARAAHAVPKDIFSANWVKISGTEFRTGLIICSQNRDRKIAQPYLQVTRNLFRFGASALLYIMVVNTKYTFVCHKITLYVRN